MKQIDLLYIMLAQSTFIGWMHVAKDTVGIIIAFVMSVISLVYLYYKTRLMKAEALLKEKELKELNG